MREMESEKKEMDLDKFPRKLEILSQYEEKLLRGGVNISSFLNSIDAEELFRSESDDNEEEEEEEEEGENSDAMEVDSADNVEETNSVPFENLSHAFRREMEEVESINKKRSEKVSEISHENHSLKMKIEENSKLKNDIEKLNRDKEELRKFLIDSLSKMIEKNKLEMLQYNHQRTLSKNDENINLGTAPEFKELLGMTESQFSRVGEVLEDLLFKLQEEKDDRGEVNGITEKISVLEKNFSSILQQIDKINASEIESSSIQKKLYESSTVIIKNLMEALAEQKEGVLSIEEGYKKSISELHEKLKKGRDISSLSTSQTERFIGIEKDNLSRFLTIHEKLNQVFSNEISNLDVIKKFINHGRGQANASNDNEMMDEPFDHIFLGKIEKLEKIASNLNKKLEEKIRNEKEIEELESNSSLEKGELSKDLEKLDLLLSSKMENLISMSHLNREGGLLMCDAILEIKNAHQETEQKFSKEISEATEHFKMKISKLEKEIEDNTNQLEEMKVDNQKNETQILLLKDGIKKKEKEIEFLNGKFEIQLSSNQSLLNEKKIEMNEILNKMSNEKEISKQEIMKTHSILNGRVLELQENINKVIQIDEENKELNSQNEQLRQYLTQIYNETNQYKEQVNQYLQHISSSTTEKIEQVSELQEKLDFNEKNFAQIGDITKDFISKIIEEKKELLNELDGLEEQGISWKNKFSDLSIINQQLEQQNFSLQSENGNLKAKIRILEETIRKNEDDIIFLNQKISLLESVNQVKISIYELHSSFSERQNSFSEQVLGFDKSAKNNAKDLWIIENEWKMDLFFDGMIEDPKKHLEYLKKISEGQKKIIEHLKKMKLERDASKNFLVESTKWIKEITSDQNIAKIENITKIGNINQTIENHQKNFDSLIEEMQKFFLENNDSKTVLLGMMKQYIAQYINPIEQGEDENLHFEPIRIEKNFESSPNIISYSKRVGKYRNMDVSLNGDNDTWSEKDKIEHRVALLVNLAESYWLSCKVKAANEYFPIYNKYIIENEKSKEVFNDSGRINRLAKFNVLSSDIEFCFHRISRVLFRNRTPLISLKSLENSSGLDGKDFSFSEYLQLRINPLTDLLGFMNSMEAKSFGETGKILFLKLQELKIDAQSEETVLRIIKTMAKKWKEYEDFRMRNREYLGNFSRGVNMNNNNIMLDEEVFKFDSLRNDDNLNPEKKKILIDFLDRIETFRLQIIRIFNTSEVFLELDIFKSLPLTTIAKASKIKNEIKSESEKIMDKDVNMNDIPSLLELQCDRYNSFYDCVNEIDSSLSGYKSIINKGSQLAIIPQSEMLNTFQLYFQKYLQTEFIEFPNFVARLIPEMISKYKHITMNTKNFSLVINRILNASNKVKGCFLLEGTGDDSMNIFKNVALCLSWVENLIKIREKIETLARRFSDAYLIPEDDNISVLIKGFDHLITKEEGDSAKFFFGNVKNAKDYLLEQKFSIFDLLERKSSTNINLRELLSSESPSDLLFGRIKGKLEKDLLRLGTFQKKYDIFLSTGDKLVFPTISFRLSWDQKSATKMTEYINSIISDIEKDKMIIPFANAIDKLSGFPREKGMVEGTIIKFLYDDHQKNIEREVMTEEIFLEVERISILSLLFLEETTEISIHFDLSTIMEQKVSNGNLSIYYSNGEKNKKIGSLCSEFQETINKELFHEFSSWVLQFLKLLEVFPQRLDALLNGNKKEYIRMLWSFFKVAALKSLFFYLLYDEKDEEFGTTSPLWREMENIIESKFGTFRIVKEAFINMGKICDSNRFDSGLLAADKVSILSNLYIRCALNQKLATKTKLSDFLLAICGSYADLLSSKINNEVITQLQNVVIMQKKKFNLENEKMVGTENVNVEDMDDEEVDSEREITVIALLSKIIDDLQLLKQPLKSDNGNKKRILYIED